jgi:hypothetical protein
MVQALQNAGAGLWNCTTHMPQADHPLMIALTTVVAVGIYICSDPLQRPWCPILSSVFGLHS